MCRKISAFLLIQLGWGTVLAAAEPSKEPAAPQATAAVQVILDEADRLLGARKPEEAIAATERALATAASDLAGQAFAHRLRARGLASSNRAEEAVSEWRLSADLWARVPRSGPEQIEALCNEALLVSRKDAGASATPADKAVLLAQAEGERPLAAALALIRCSDRGWQIDALDLADKFGLAAHAIYEQRAPASLELAASFNNLGNLASERGRLDEAVDAYQRGLDLRQKLAPDSDAVSGSLVNLGVVARQRGDLEGAQSYYERALAIDQRRAPDSLDVASVLNNLGNVARDRGDLDAARDYLERALAIKERLAPGSMTVARSLQSLGVVLEERGELDLATEQFMRCLAIQEKLAPGSLGVAITLNALGGVAFDRGDLDAAQNYRERALTIQEKLAPGSLDVAAVLNNLGIIARERRDLAAATGLYQRALAIYEKLSPGSPAMAGTFGNMAGVARDGGDLLSARKYVEQSLAIWAKIAPGSLDLARSLNNLGHVTEAQGDLEAARTYREQSLAIKEKVAPASLETAATLNDLGNLHRKRGELKEAEPALARAWSIVRSQRRGISGDEAGRAFTAATARYAAELANVRLALGHTATAFEALEQGRAQALLQLVSERGVVGSAVSPELWRRYEIAEKTFQRTAGALASAGTEEARLASGAATSQGARQTTQEDIGKVKRAREEALDAYTQARLEQERLLGEIRKAVPGLEPHAFTFEQARRALPSGAVFVAWLVGEDASSIFMIPADPKQPVRVERIPLSERQLGARVAALRDEIGTGERLRGIGGLTEGGEPAAARKLVATSHELFEALFPPAVRPALEKARRIVLSPDGPLWELPFAALATKGSGDPRWLGLAKPLSFTPSLTLLAMEREQPRLPAGGGHGALVVGDPVFVRSTEKLPADEGTQEALRGERAALVSGKSVPPRLPATAEEARRIAALYGTEPLLGEDATEAAVRKRISSAAIVHLATHGYFHPRLALSSGVLLAPAASQTSATEDDGALQAWEFGRTLPLDAQLVVLSACETGRGEKVQGEGLVGLTRALQAAGARSVLATQWKVADKSTAALMVSFHEKLRSGLSKDEALRRAMAEIAASPTTSAPFWWAAFVLTGDADQPLALN